MKPELHARVCHFLFRAGLMGDRPQGSGFTLIELLVVLVIAGILSAIALPSFVSQVNNARQAEARTYVGSINRAQQAYFLEKSAFATLSQLELSISNSKNYIYSSAPNGSGMASKAITLALPVGQARGFAGKVWLMPDLDGNANTVSSICEGPPGDMPDLASPTCAGS